MEPNALCSIPVSPCAAQQGALLVVTKALEKLKFIVRVHWPSKYELWSYFSSSSAFLTSCKNSTQKVFLLSMNQMEFSSQWSWKAQCPLWVLGKYCTVQVHQNHKQLSHSERNVSIGCCTKGTIKQQREKQRPFGIFPSGRKYKWQQ